MLLLSSPSKMTPHFLFDLVLQAPSATRPAPPPRRPRRRPGAAATRRPGRGRTSARSASRIPSTLSTPPSRSVVSQSLIQSNGHREQRRPCRRREGGALFHAELTSLRCLNVGRYVEEVTFRECCFQRSKDSKGLISASLMQMRASQQSATFSGQVHFDVSCAKQNNQRLKAMLLT